MHEKKVKFYQNLRTLKTPAKNSKLVALTSQTQVDLRIRIHVHVENVKSIFKASQRLNTKQALQYNRFGRPDKHFQKQLTVANTNECLPWV